MRSSPSRPASTPARPAVAPACTLELKVVPNAPRDDVAGWAGDVLRLRLQAPPVDGRANEALVAFLARRLDLPPRAITLLRGDKSRHKAVRINGLTLADVRARLGAP